MLSCNAWNLREKRGKEFCIAESKDKVKNITKANHVSSAALLASIPAVLMRN